MSVIRIVRGALNLTKVKNGLGAVPSPVFYEQPLKPTLLKNCPFTLQKLPSKSRPLPLFSMVSKTDA